MTVLAHLVLRMLVKTMTRKAKRTQKAAAVQHTLIILTCVVIWMMKTLFLETYAFVAAMIRPVEIKIGKERTRMPQILRETAAYSTFKIKIQSMTLRFMMTMISLPRICAVFMVEAAIIQKAYMTYN